MTRAEFQGQFGEAWAGITSNPAFFAAMQLVSAAKLQRIGTVTDQEIAEHGTAILADFRGHLQMENALIDLAVAAGEPAFDLPPETYRDPSQPEPLPPAEELESKSFIHFQAPKPKKQKPRKRKPR